jgi:hypothetical protein
MRKAQASHMTAQSSHDRARQGNAEMTRVPKLQLSEQISSSMKLIVVTKKMIVSTRF